MTVLKPALVHEEEVPLLPQNERDDASNSAAALAGRDQAGSGQSTTSLLPSGAQHGAEIS